jgi:ParB family transcriptional regulator, chromosome partitioning protein
MSGTNANDPKPSLSYKGSLSGLKGLLKNRISEGIHQVVNTLGISPEDEFAGSGGTQKLPIEMIYPCPDQPRQVFEPKALEELSATMRELGQAQAITVRQTERGFEIISGERRYRAAKLAGFTHLDCVIKDVDAKDARLLALVENIQRQDLLPIEESHFLKKILSENPDLSLEKLARMIGSHKSTISEKIQLTEIPEELQRSLYSSGRSFTHRHWRVLSRIKEPAMLTQMLMKAIEHQMSVADLEKSLDAMGIPKISRRKARSAAPRISSGIESGGNVYSASSDNFIEFGANNIRLRPVTLDRVKMDNETKAKLISEFERVIEYLRANNV